MADRGRNRPLRGKIDDLWLNLRWAFGYTWKIARLWLVALVFAAFANSALLGASAWVGRSLVNSVVEILDQGLATIEPAVQWLVLAFVLALAQQVLSAISQYANSRLNESLVLGITKDMLHHAASLDVSRFEDPDFQDVFDRANQNAPVHFANFVVKTIGLAQSLLLVISLAAVLLAIDPVILAIVLPIIGPYIFFKWRHVQDKFGKEFTRTTRRRWTRYFLSLLTGRSSLPEVKLLGLSPTLIDRYYALSRKFAQEDRALLERELRIDVAFALVFIVGLYGLFVRIAGRIVQGLLTIGDLSVFMAVTMRLQNTLSNMVDGAAGLMEETLYIGNLNEYFDIQPRLAERATRREIPALAGEIEIEDLTFSYPGNQQVVLSELSLRIQPGETVAIVGENGAGKTTLVKLLARLYDPDNGRIRIDGIDIRDIPLEDLHRQFAFVFQTFNRYEATAADNIAYGDIESALPRERVVQIAEHAGVDEMIRAMPDGYDTMLGRMFGQYDLSVGQWQKIAIARATARDAAILILDEPTASLDARAEYQLFEHFRELAQGRTTILISHRFSTISMADRIVVLDGGRIIEMGSHLELLHNNGLYAQLFSLQQRQLGLEGNQAT